MSDLIYSDTIPEVEHLHPQRLWTAQQLWTLLAISERTFWRRLKAGKVERVDTPDGARYRPAFGSELAVLPDGSGSDPTAIPRGSELNPDEQGQQSTATALGLPPTATLLPFGSGSDGSRTTKMKTDVGVKPPQSTAMGDAPTVIPLPPTATPLPTDEAAGLTTVVQLVVLVRELTQQLAASQRQCGHLEARLAQAHAGLGKLEKDNQTAWEVIGDLTTEALELERRLAVLEDANIRSC